jgi:outer membrane protein OmpA-like peptidoglycan-associated protein
MDAGTCQRTLARLAAAGSVRFEPGGASPLLESYRLLNDLATVAYQCPETRIIIGGHTDASGDPQSNRRLSQARAEAVKRFFHLAGIRAERMQTVAYGDSRPVASNATPEGRAANRRITFHVLPNQ